MILNTMYVCVISTNILWLTFLIFASYIYIMRLEGNYTRTVLDICWPNRKLVNEFSNTSNILGERIQKWADQVGLLKYNKVKYLNNLR